MSDAKQPEQMRPIPDGGLKDAMPSWLKRPPAWRDLPTAEQRHERSLSEPDTSEIDPRSLVDVTDLPQWLQAIAARGEIPVPTPDASVDHAVEVVQAAQKPVPVESAVQTEVAPVDPGFLPGLDDPTDETSISETTPSVANGTTAPESAQVTPTFASSTPGRFPTPIWMWPVVALVLIMLVIILFLVM